MFGREVGRGRGEYRTVDVKTRENNNNSNGRGGSGWAVTSGQQWGSFRTLLVPYMHWVVIEHTQTPALGYQSGGWHENRIFTYTHRRKIFDQAHTGLQLFTDHCPHKYKIASTALARYHQSLTTVHPLPQSQAHTHLEGEAGDRKLLCPHAFDSGHGPEIRACVCVYRLFVAYERVRDPE
jgi:hypothetical protein